MLIYEKTKNMASQREIPKMCLIDAQITLEGVLTIKAPGKETLTISNLNQLEKSKPDYEVNIWKSNVMVVDCGDFLSNWFSEFLERRLRLVVTPCDYHRSYSINRTKYLGIKNEGVHFQDGYPLLLTSMSTLRDLQSKVKTRTFDMRVFRSNLIVDGSNASEEYTWNSFLIGKNPFHNVKLCGRCTVPNVDPDTGKTYKEPSETLKRFFSMEMDGEIENIFGINVVHEKVGKIKIGDEIQVLTWKESPKFFSE
jgi:uncharacterized protein